MKHGVIHLNVFIVYMLITAMCSSLISRSDLQQVSLINRDFQLRTSSEELTNHKPKETPLSKENHNHKIVEYVGSGGLLLEITVLVYIFCGFTIICEKFLVPAIRRFKDVFNMSERLAGSTILALGGCISEIASNMNAVLIDNQKEFELGLTGIIGASMCEMTLGIALGCLLNKNSYSLSFLILSRDMLIYLCVIVLLYIVVAGQYITVVNSGVLCIVWVLYCFYVIVTANQEDEETVYVDMGMSNALDESMHYKPIAQHLEASTKPEHQKPTEELEDEILRYVKQQDESIVLLAFKALYRLVTKPWDMAMEVITPRFDSKIAVVLQFLIPLVVIWYTTEIEVHILSRLVSRWEMPAGFLGMTIMSWGNVAPDMFNIAYAMKSGLVDLALTGAIASEIHVILIGLGFPWFYYNISFGKAIKIKDLSFYSPTLFYYCVFLLAFILILKANKVRLDHVFAIFLGFSYAVFLMLIAIATYSPSKLNA